MKDSKASHGEAKRDTVGCRHSSVADDRVKSGIGGIPVIFVEYVFAPDFETPMITLHTGPQIDQRIGIDPI